MRVDKPSVLSQLGTHPQSAERATLRREHKKPRSNSKIAHLHIRGRHPVIHSFRDHVRSEIPTARTE